MILHPFFYVFFLIFNNKWATKIEDGLGQLKPQGRHCEYAVIVNCNIQRQRSLETSSIFLQKISTNFLCSHPLTHFLFSSSHIGSHTASFFFFFLLFFSLLCSLCLLFSSQAALSFSFTECFFSHLLCGTQHNSTTSPFYLLHSYVFQLQLTLHSCL